MAQCIVIGPTGMRVTLEPTDAFATKELAGQAAFHGACKHIEDTRRKRTKRG